MKYSKTFVLALGCFFTVSASDDAQWTRYIINRVEQSFSAKLSFAFRDILCRESEWLTSQKIPLVKPEIIGALAPEVFSVYDELTGLTYVVRKDGSMIRISITTLCYDANVTHMRSDPEFENLLCAHPFKIFEIMLWQGQKIVLDDYSSCVYQYPNVEIVTVMTVDQYKALVKK